ncbi:hypothetical protein [Microvirga alba]|uniref:Uncharacterized protein n=1 Tax=Microvirga alba TaxID=2791025 RepID=A0A931BLS5_9HYPH|nr:hypothetical protein [Microvirga alba]MBF9233412.1 hypothetical protein [Microvirga alba]
MKAGLSVGVLLGAWHLGWALLVALGWAQPLINFVLWIHFIQPIYVIGPFDLTRAALLVVVTTVAGFVIGWAFAAIWNRLHRRRTAEISVISEARRATDLKSRR